MNFGDFISAKRKEKNVSLRQMALDLKISAPYLTDIEKDRRNPPEKKLEEIATLLGLSDDDKRIMYDLAAEKVNAVIPPDLPDYIRENNLAVTFLRKTKEKNYSREDWQRLLDKIDDEEG